MNFRSLSKKFLITFIFLLLTQAVFAKHHTKHTKHAKHVKHVTALAVKPLYASVVMDYPSKTILSSENPHLVTKPASLTKVMTLYLVFKALDNGTLKLFQPLRVSAHAASQQPSILGLKANETITTEEAICGLVTKSANDAAAVLAESLAPSEETFALAMTQEAQRLGMQNTTFKNASGIPNQQQLTTAMDMAILGAAIIHDFPHYYHYFSLKEFSFDSKLFKNHNHLLGKYEGCDGIKTGYTTASGFNLLSSVERNGHRLIGVVLGGSSIKSRDDRMMQILDEAFSKLTIAASPASPSVIPSVAAPLQTSDKPIQIDPPKVPLVE